MNKATIILILLFSFFSIPFLKAQTYSSMIEDKEIVGFLKWHSSQHLDTPILSDYRIYKVSQNILKWHHVMLYTKKDSLNEGVYQTYCIYNPRNNYLDSTFTDEEKKYIYKQFQSQITTKWADSVSKMIANYGRKTNKKYSYNISLPLFTTDKKYVILRQVWNCGGNCGEEHINLYKKDNDGWHFYRQLVAAVF